MLKNPENIITVEDFEGFIDLPENQDRLLELINGEIVEKMPTEEHGEITLTIGAMLREFVIPRKLGRVGVEIRHRIPHDDHNSRLPDVSFTAGNRPRVTEGSVPQMPDLAIEVKSPRDTLKSLRARAEYYLANGSKMVWLFISEKRMVIYLTLDEELILLENDVLEGGDVLPGFSVLVRLIFADPLQEE